MNILDFSIDAAVDYGKNNRHNLKALAKAAEDNSLSDTSVTDEELALLEKELCTCGCLKESEKLLRRGDPRWHRNGLRYFATGLAVVPPNLDRLWNKRFSQIKAGCPVLESTPSPALRLLVGFLSILFFAAAAAVFLVPDLLLLLRENSAVVLIGILGVVLIPLSLLFSFVGLIFAIVILINLFEEAEPWLEELPALLQDWIAPAALALVLAVIGILFLVKFRSMPSRSKAKAAYEAQMAAYHSRVEAKIKEAEEFISSCRRHLSLQSRSMATIAEILMRDENGSEVTPEILELALTADLTKQLLAQYDSYMEQLKKVKPER